MSHEIAKYSIEEIEKYRLDPSKCHSEMLSQMLIAANVHYDNHEVTKEWRDAIVVSFTPFIR